MAVQEEEITKKIIGVTHEGWLELNEAEGVKNKMLEIMKRGAEGDF